MCPRGIPGWRVDPTGGIARGFGRTTVESTSRRAAATSSRRNRAIVAADCPLGL